MTDCDVLIVGGGIHGAGIAQAAAARGYRTLLVEKTALAAGTSSRSSKLIHGGLRYLEQGAVGLVREALRERAILLRIAPHLVHPLSFHLPVYRDGTRSAFQVRAGLSLYALLGGLAPMARFEAIPRHQWDRLDGLDTNGLVTVYRFRDAQTDDVALTQAVFRSAESFGAELLCPATFVGATRTRGGYAVHLALANGEGREIAARTLINAAGPWVGQVTSLIDPLPLAAAASLVQGTHIELAGAMQGACYLEAPDRRAVFALPWKGGRTLVGTTETPFAETPSAESPHSRSPDAVRPLAEEIDYLQRAFRRYFPGRSDTVLDAFAGLRVLPKGNGAAFDRPRDVRLHRDPDHPRLISIYGGKLTCYRSTADKVLRHLSAVLPTARTHGDTATLSLPWALP